MKEKIDEIKKEICANCIGCNEDCPVVDKILAHLKEKGWRSGEEVAKYSVRITEGTEKQVRTYYEKHYLDPEAQISETCSECENGWKCTAEEGGKKFECIEEHGIEPKDCYLCEYGEKCKTCNGSGEVGAWVRCESCKGTSLICTFTLGGKNEIIEDGCECDYAVKTKSYNLHSSDKCECEQPCDTCQDGLIPLTNKLALEWAGQKYEIIKKGVKG
jgi:hypothetical protein